MVDNVLNNGFGEKERREEIRKATEKPRATPLMMVLLDNFLPSIT